MLHSSSSASTASTRSRESAFRSSWNRASGTTCTSSTASCSASTFFTRVSISARSVIDTFLLVLGWFWAGSWGRGWSAYPLGGQSAVDGDHRAVHGRGLLGHQEPDDRRHLLEASS